VLEQPSSATATGGADLPIVCCSHLRWDFVFQRPQHLLSRAPAGALFFEEPVDGPARDLRLARHDDVTVATPTVPADDPAPLDALRVLLDRAVREVGYDRYVAWYYTPAALRFSELLTPEVVVYDCMDDLSSFAHADPLLPRLERRLLERADVVFTGGHALHGRLRDRHPHVYAFPSSVDAPHFARARHDLDDPQDQASLARPRIGFAGVIDERIDLDLLHGLALARPDWMFVLVGPVAKIDPADVPSDLPNVHALGMRAYRDLPRYLAGWDVAIMPFAKNRATRYISPTKTLEYLAADLPVVSTSITDVVEPYGRAGAVRIADGVDAFVAAIEADLAGEDRSRRRMRGQELLATTTWDRTWDSMWRHVTASLDERTAVSA
jgi:glycosyltransferase involved in cell wall biosynthesis